MIKPDDIQKHTAEFFTSDPDFVLWCLDPERAQDGYGRFAFRDVDTDSIHKCNLQEKN